MLLSHSTGEPRVSGCVAREVSTTDLARLCLRLPFWQLLWSILCSDLLVLPVTINRYWCRSTFAIVLGMLYILGSEESKPQFYTLVQQFMIHHAHTKSKVSPLPPSMPLTRLLPTILSNLSPSHLLNIHFAPLSSGLTRPSPMLVPRKSPTISL